MPTNTCTYAEQKDNDFPASNITESQAAWGLWYYLYWFTHIILQYSQTAHCVIYVVCKIGKLDSTRISASFNIIIV